MDFFYILGRDVREAEGARLESVYAGNRIGGSNPSLSAIIVATVVTLLLTVR